MPPVTKTYFGKTAQLVQEAHTVSHFQKAVLKIGNYLIILAVALVAVIIGFALYRGDRSPDHLAVRPGADGGRDSRGDADGTVGDHGGGCASARQETSDRQQVGGDRGTGRRGRAVCRQDRHTDQNKLTLGDPFCVNDVTADQIVLDGALASRADNNDTIDLAVLGGVKDQRIPEELSAGPFPALRSGAQAHRGHGKGQGRQRIQGEQGRAAGDSRVGGQCRAIKTAVEKAINEFAARGFRSLGVARADQDGQWQFLGVLPLFDPPRDDAKATIATALTDGRQGQDGDGRCSWPSPRRPPRSWAWAPISSMPAAWAISRRKRAAAVVESIEKADGFAQVFPEHKFHIVDDLQKRGHIVGMTGDGVNDAPALKKADCGIAVSGATDAARAAASIVLMAPGLSVIIDAIKESRKIFQRMNSYAIYRIAETLRVLFFMTLAILIFNFYPVTAVMIVMLALLNDGAILSIAYDNVHYKDQPEAWNMRMVLGISTVLGVIGVVAAFGLFYLAERVFHLDRAHAQTMMYLKLSVAGHLTIFLTRTRGPFWSIRPREDIMDGGARYTNRCDDVCGVRFSDDTAGLGMGAFRVGLCVGVVPRE